LRFLFQLSLTNKPSNEALACLIWDMLMSAGFGVKAERALTACLE